MPIVLIACDVFIVLLQPILPYIINEFLFINKSRLRSKTFVVTEYFVDQDKYFYLILLHMNIAICTGAFAIAATGTTLLALLKHACGMFSIVR